MLVGLLAYGVASERSQTSASSSFGQGDRPPETEARLQALGGTEAGAVDDYRGKVVLVNFWASWCPPCTDELPLLQRAQVDLERAGATVLGINSRDNSEDALKWVRDKGLTFPTLRDRAGDLADTWGVQQLPETYLLDADGRVKAFLKGPLTQKWIDANVTPVVDAAR